jgi:hypothetical protein
MEGVTFSKEELRFEDSFLVLIYFSRFWFCKTVSSKQYLTAAMVIV